MQQYPVARAHKRTKINIKEQDGEIMNALLMPDLIVVKKEG